MEHIEFNSLQELELHLQQGKCLTDAVIHSLDLSNHTPLLTRSSLKNALFLGCLIEPDALEHLWSRGAFVFPRLDGLPFSPYRSSLYNPDELLIEGYEHGMPESLENTLDVRVYRHFLKTGKNNPSSFMEALARRLHDHFIAHAVEDFIGEKRVIAIMGDHKLRRDDPNYLKVAMLSRSLTNRGYLMVSGGGPGAMEATHLGAWFADYHEGDLEDAIRIMTRAPSFEPKYRWLEAALEVKSKYPGISDKGGPPKSLGLPTWLYGHEPPTIFATHIAKYFANSVREVGLLSIAVNGVIFAPGGTGTLLEIFLNAAQNHYKASSEQNPMILFDNSY